MGSPLRLIATNPLDQLARTLEALLVVASAPLSVPELAEAADDDPERVEAALGLVRERYTEGRSGIVLEHVAGGWAFRSAREAAQACARLFEKPAQRNLSQAALETKAAITSGVPLGLRLGVSPSMTRAVTAIQVASRQLLAKGLRPVTR